MQKILKKQFVLLTLLVLVFFVGGIHKASASLGATNLSAAETYTEDTALNLVDIVITNSDNGTSTATLTISNTAAGSLSTATSGAVTSTYNAGTGVWTAAGATANVNTILSGVTFTPATNFNGNFTITTSVSDGGASATVNGSKNFTGTPVNDAPQATNLSAAETYTEDTALNLIDIVTSDVDTGQVLTVQLTLSNAAAGSLNTGTSGASTSTYNAGTGVWTVTGIVTDVNNLLAGLTFTPASNFNGSFTIATSVSDGIAGAITGSKSVTGVAVNDAPQATNMNASETYTVNTTLNLINIVVTDVDSTVTITLTLSNHLAGSLSTATSGAVTSTYNAGTGVWTAAGAVADINTLLAALTFTPTTSFNSSFTIATSVSDGVASAITGSKDISTAPLNNAPVLDASKSPSLLSIVHNAGTAVGTVGTQVSSLVDLTPPSGGLDNVTDSDSSPMRGVAVIASDTTDLTCEYSLDGGTTWLALGGLSSSSSRLLAADSDNRIYCYSTSHESGTFVNALTFRAWDQTSGTDGATADTTTSGGTSAFSSVTDTISLTVTNSVTTGTNLDTPETYIKNSPIDLTDIVISDNDDTTVFASLILSDPVAGTLNTGTSGSVTSTYDPSTGIWSANGAIADVNILLAGVIFTPAHNFIDDFSIATDVSDGELGSSGSKAFTSPSTNAPSTRHSGSSGSTSGSTTVGGNLKSNLPIATTTSATFIFTHDLKIGMVNQDVIQLQKFLNAHGFPVATTGAGSPGNEITRFGALTRAAVAKFQSSKNISPAVGFFGPITRGVVNPIMAQ